MILMLMWRRLRMLMSLWIIVSKKMGSMGMGRMWMIMRMLIGDEDTEGIG